MQIEGVPDGWELVRIGNPKKGDHYMNSTGTVMRAGQDRSCSNRPIIRKVQRWRPAKPSDLDGGVPVNARFRDDLDDDWIEDVFDGYIADTYFCFRRKGSGVIVGWHCFCEVLDDA